jgi:hypothetical protein
MSIINELAHVHLVMKTPFFSVAQSSSISNSSLQFRISPFKTLFILSILEKDRYKNEIWVSPLSGFHHY